MQEVELIIIVKPLQTVFFFFNMWGKASLLER